MKIIETSFVIQVDNFDRQNHNCHNQNQPNMYLQGLANLERFN